LYRCFRASCGKKGFIGDFKKREVTLPQKRKGPPKYPGGLINLHPDEIAEHFGKYEISQTDVTQNGIRRTTDGEWFYFPIFNYRGLQIGEHLRRINKDKPGSKARTFRWTEDTLLYFPIGNGFNGRLVLVEDPISAIKVSKIENCAALLGTHLGDDALQLLKLMMIQRVVIMCDGDSAGRKAAIGIKDRLAPFFHVRTVYLDLGRNPRDISYRELRRFLLI
jgi:hypothetical protein